MGAALFVLVGSFFLTNSAFAGTQDAAVVVVDCPTAFIKGDPCFSGVVPCSEADVQQDPLHGWFAWMFVARADAVAGVAGVSCGVSVTDQLSVDRWFLCVGEEVTSGAWPDSGSGNRITWDAETDCQRRAFQTDGVHALAGVFYLYSYGDASLEITPNTAEGETAIIVTDCSGEDSELSTPGGRIGFGSVEGYNPCLEDVPVARRTWGRIKAHY